MTFPDDFAAYRAAMLDTYKDAVAWATRSVCPTDLSEPERVLLALLCCSLRTGAHNLGPMRLLRPLSSTGARFAISDNHFATADSDALARLVIGAHDLCARVAVGPCGPHRIEVRLWLREGRYGGVAERHPTLDNAADEMRRRVLG